MKTAISIPDPVFRAADRTAKRLGISRSELYARAVAAFVGRSDELTAALDRVYVDEPSKTDGALAELQRRALSRSEW